MMRRSSFLVAVALVLFIPLLTACTHNTPPTPSPIENNLRGIVALSATNVWAVGEMTASDGDHILIEHWDGSKWRVTSPSMQGILYGIAALSAKDVWAVGDDTSLIRDDMTGIARHTHNTLTLHWDGKRWSRVPSPTPGTSMNDLNSVSGASSRDVWVIGSARSYSSIPMILHWDGKKWSVVPQPASFPFQVARLTSVKALSSTDVWVVGEYTALQGGGMRTLAEHWDGKHWWFVATPDRNVPATFHGLTTFAPKHLLAVGQTDQGSNELPGALVEQWNGSRWDILAEKQEVANLQDVAALTSRDVWAVGESSTGPSSSLMMLHWNGRSWLVINLPTAGAMWSFLNAMDAVAANDIWIVGWTSFSYPAKKTLVEHWDGTHWRIIPTPNPGTPGPIMGEP